MKDKEKTLKAAREKKQVTYNGTPKRLSADFSAETLQARRESMLYLMWWKEKNSNQDYSAQQGSHLDLKEKSKASQLQKLQKLREFSTIKLTLQEIVKELL